MWAWIKKCASIVHSSHKTISMVQDVIDWKIQIIFTTQTPGFGKIFPYYPKYKDLLKHTGML